MKKMFLGITGLCLIAALILPSCKKKEEPAPATPPPAQEQTAPATPPPAQEQTAPAPQQAPAAPEQAK